MSEFYFFYAGPLSNWHQQPFTVQGKQFCCCEQFIMWSKAVLFSDFDAAAKILATSNPSEHQRLGRTVKNFNEEIWATFRGGIAYVGNYAKFSQNPELDEFLMQTGNKVLVEASKKDRIWGIGLAQNDPLAQKKETWCGLNLLGYTLSRVREARRWERSLKGKANNVSVMTRKNGCLCH